MNDKAKSVPNPADDRLRLALEELRHFRRRQHTAVAHTPLWFNLCYWSGILALVSVFFGCAIGALIPETGSAVVGLGMTICLLTVGLVMACFFIRWAGTLALLIMSIPKVLFFQARMHLLDLLLIVALLGNGIGLIVGQLEETEPGKTIFLCVCWVILILGGATWGIWVSTHLKVSSSGIRCGLMLTGVLTPAALLGLAVGPCWLTIGLAELPRDIGRAFAMIGLGLATGSASFLLIHHAYMNHRQAWIKAGAARLKRRREEARERIAEEDRQKRSEAAERNSLAIHASYAESK